MNEHAGVDTAVPPEPAPDAPVLRAAVSAGTPHLGGPAAAGCDASVGALPFVSHCYRRPRRLPHWRYNLFAMVHGRNRSDTESLIGQIAPILGGALRARDVLYSVRILKKTGLRL